MGLRWYSVISQRPAKRSRISCTAPRPSAQSAMAAGNEEFAHAIVGAPTGRTRHHREAHRQLRLRNDQWEGVGIAKPARHLIWLAMTHFAQHREDPGAHGVQVIDVVPEHLRDPGAVFPRSAGVSQTDGQRPILQQKARSRARAPVRAICEPTVGLESVTSRLLRRAGTAPRPEEQQRQQAASAAELARRGQRHLASAEAEEAEAAAESAAAGAASCLAQAASASAATRALRTSFVFIELYPEKEKGKR